MAVHAEVFKVVTADSFFKDFVRDFSFMKGRAVKYRLAFAEILKTMTKITAVVFFFNNQGPYSFFFSFA